MIAQKISIGFAMTLYIRLYYLKRGCFFKSNHKMQCPILRRFFSPYPFSCCTFNFIIHDLKSNTNFHWHFCMHIRRYLTFLYVFSVFLLVIFDCPRDIHTSFFPSIIKSVGNSKSYSDTAYKSFYIILQKPLLEYAYHA